MSAISELHRRVFGHHGQRIFWRGGQLAKVAADIALRHGVSASALMAQAATLPIPAPKQKAGRPDFSVTRDAAATDGKQFSFVASDGLVDRNGDTVNPHGWKFAEYKRNPVVLWSHEAGLLPVGKATYVGVQNDRLMATIQFAKTGMGRAVSNLVSGGFLSAVSVGFSPIKFAFSNDPTRKGGIDFASTDLWEISVVGIPANARALLQSITGTNGKSIDVTRRAARERDLALLKVRHAPLTAREQRAVNLARAKMVTR
jgi:HK97 family phage prohead protease